MIFFERKLLSELMIGCTHYVDVGDPQQVSFYYPSDSEVHMKTLDSKVLKGQMTIKDAGYNINWDNAPDNKSYYKIAEHLGAYVYIDDQGRSAGTITKIVSGNPEYF